jgi:hypothetical protein
VSEAARREALFYLGESEVAKIEERRALGIIVTGTERIIGYRVLRYVYDAELYVLIVRETPIEKVVLRRDALTPSSKNEAHFGSPVSGATFVGISRDGVHLVDRRSPYSFSVDFSKSQPRIAVGYGENGYVDEYDE